MTNLSEKISQVNDKISKIYKEHPDSLPPFIREKYDAYIDQQKRIPEKYLDDIWMVNCPHLPIGVECNTTLTSCDDCMFRRKINE